MIKVLNEQEILKILESSLGPGIKDKKTQDYTFDCPICKWHKPKLVVNIHSGFYNCWTCKPSAKTKGPNVVKLLEKLGVDKEKTKRLSKLLGKKTTRVKEEISTTIINLPEEYKPLSVVKHNDLEYTLAINYAKKRKLTDDDILKYDIGYCDSGKYKRRLIVPSYDADGNLNYFIARSYEINPRLKIDTPSVEKSKLIGFEYYINWNVPIILCEGVFDAIAIKRNAIPLFGTSIGSALMKKIVHSEVKTIYLALDKDAIMHALDHVEQLMNYGKDVYFLNLQDKDPSKIGFNGMLDILQSAKPIDFKMFYLEKLKIS